MRLLFEAREGIKKTGTLLKRAEAQKQSVSKN